MIVAKWLFGGGETNPECWRTLRRCTCRIFPGLSFEKGSTLTLAVVNFRTALPYITTEGATDVRKRSTQTHAKVISSDHSRTLLTKVTTVMGRDWERRSKRLHDKEDDLSRRGKSRALAIVKTFYATDCATDCRRTFPRRAAMFRLRDMCWLRSAFLARRRPFWKRPGLLNKSSLNEDYRYYSVQRGINGAIRGRQLLIRTARLSLPKA